ncbi:hypothetical protein CC86DRAFT_399926 [Ophiobolus disseminans]|uniref:Uncharacterized protein n=1 Tax=Ophiobolus disseminans TaxID=1469910 RepID=A0A6A7AL20_9PLEO|nr:hypothetical protein CC86DRAFT_399926 [Ophiobolus disseminans]
MDAEYGAQHALRNLQHAHATTTNLNARLQELYEETRQCEKDLMEAQMVEDDELFWYAQIWSHQLALAVYTTLPRELRDCAYTYLWGDKVRSCRNVLLEQSRQGFRLHKDFVRMLPDCTRPEVMGEDVANEVMSLLYRDSSAQPYKCVQAENVFRALTVDFFERSFKILNWIKTFHIDWTIEKNMKAAKASLRDMSRLQFPHSIAVELEFNLFPFLVRKITNRLVDKLEESRPWFNTMVRQGHTVTVTVTDESWLGDITSFYTTSSTVWVTQVLLKAYGWDENV